MSMYNVAERKDSLRAVAIILGVLVFILIQINHRRYKDTYDEFETRWGNLDEKTKDKLDVITFIMAVIPFISLPIITNVFDFTK